MRKITQSNKITDGFELRIFRYGLLVATGFRIFRSLHEIVTTDYPLPLTLIGFVNLALLTLLFHYHRRFFRTCLLIFFIQTLFTCFLTWDVSGGWHGPNPYIIIPTTIAIVMTSHGTIQYILLFLYASAIGLLIADDSLFRGFDTHLNTAGFTLYSLQVYFTVTIFMVILMTHFMKLRYVRYRRSIMLVSQRLAQSNQILKERAAGLEEQMAELNTIKDNLEQIVKTKVNEANLKANVLQRFAFVNAHHTRGPLARILGLIQLIEYEYQGRPVPATLANIKRCAREMDDIVRKINKITSE